MTLWQQLVDTYRNTPMDAPGLRAITLAQWALESGRGTSRLAREHLNFAGLQYRPRMAGHAARVTYTAHDGTADYCAFDSIPGFIKGYWRFIESGPYGGWRDCSDDPRGFVRHLHARGYAADPAYEDKVLDLLDSAEYELRSGSQRPPRVAVVVGHNPAARGAYALPPVDAAEYDYNARIARAMAQRGPDRGLDVRVFHRFPARFVGEELRRVYRATGDWDADATIELHFNAVADASVRGTETLSSGSSGSLRLADAVQAEVVALFARGHDRGVKVRRRHQRGGYSLHAGRAPAILVESFFGSSPDDTARAAEVGEAALAEAYLRGMARGLA